MDTEGRSRPHPGQDFSYVRRRDAGKAGGPTPGANCCIVRAARRSADRAIGVSDRGMGSRKSRTPAKVKFIVLISARSRRFAGRVGPRREEMKNCHRCPWEGEKEPRLGEGNPHAELVFWEAPGPMKISRGALRGAPASFSQIIATWD